MFTQVKAALAQHLCLFHTFFGLDAPVRLPPNFVVTGTTAPRLSGELRETSDQDFNTWLQSIRAEGLKLVYVTMGSMQKLKPFQVDALYHGLASLDPPCAVAWSLKR